MRLRGRNAFRLGARFALERIGIVGRIAKYAAEKSSDLVPGAQGKTNRLWNAVPADRELSHFLGHVPEARAAGREKRHIAGAEPFDLAVVIGDKNLARNN